jgi:hypothetical protein
VDCKGKEGERKEGFIPEMRREGLVRLRAVLQADGGEGNIVAVRVGSRLRVGLKTTCSSVFSGMHGTERMMHSRVAG